VQRSGLASDCSYGLKKHTTEVCATTKSEEFFVRVEFAVFAGVVEGNVAVSAAFAGVNLTGVEGLGIDVNADGALLEFRQIQDLMNGFERIYVDGVSPVHLVDFRRNDLTSAAGGVFFFDAKILDFQAPDGSGHPAVLIAMIVDAAVLADFPANSHTLEEVVLENEIAGVIAFGEEEVFLKRFRADGVLSDVVLNVFESEVTLGN
jgi:hypothetical protein